MIGSAFNLASAYQARGAKLYASGLTPGSSYTFKWAHYVSGGVTLGLKAGQSSGDEGAAVMQVFSA